MTGYCKARLGTDGAKLGSWRAPLYDVAELALGPSGGPRVKWGQTAAPSCCPGHAKGARRSER